MSEGTLTITITKEGRIKSDIKGVKGKECMDVDSFLADFGTVENVIKTREYSEQKEQQQRVVRFN